MPVGVANSLQMSVCIIRRFYNLTKCKSRQIPLNSYIIVLNSLIRKKCFLVIISSTTLLVPVPCISLNAIEILLVDLSLHNTGHLD